MNKRRKKEPTLWVLARALVFSVCGLAFGAYGVWVGFAHEEYLRATFFLALALNCDSSYLLLASVYDLRPSEAPNAE